MTALRCNVMLSARRDQQQPPRLRTLRYCGLNTKRGDLHV